MSADMIAQIYCVLRCPLFFLAVIFGIVFVWFI